ncbi:uncharacterized protein LOC117115673 [Anneissia japonica]|uniref:uncharacterized protein LOC117115673 n=1 Tax=Anneissia japonica TaxID=1529436 RepID=UPI001425B545|nr:uncharacterized protein LOC117115673 [Anneissia japonica]
MCGRCGEFSVRNFGCRGAVLEDFTVPRCPWPGQPASYVTYRVLIAVYQCAWNILVPFMWNDRRFFTNHTAETVRWKWFIYISNWSYLILSFYFIMAALSNFYHHVKVHCKCSTKDTKNDEMLYADSGPDSFQLSRDSMILSEKCDSNVPVTEADNHPPPKMMRHISTVSGEKLISKNRKQYYGFQTALPWYFKLTWILQSCAFSLVLIITAMYWIIEFDSTVSEVTVFNVHVHGVALFLVVLDLFLTASPVRFFHFVYPSFVVIAYIIFTYIYYRFGGTNEYGDSYLYKDWVDWKNIETKTSIVAVCTTFVAVPVAHMLFCLLHLIRKRMFRCYEKKYIL